MHGRLDPKRLTRLPRARLVAFAALTTGVLVVGCGGSSQQPGAGATVATTVATGAASTVAAPSGAPLHCPSGPCFSPQQYRAAYGIQPLLDNRIDGRGETVTVVAPVPPPNAGPTDIRRDLASFDRTFRLPAARIEVVTSLGGSASPWLATGEEAGDLEHVHTVAPSATLRVVLIPSNVLQSAANATADMVAALRLAVSETDVASISWSLGEHYFTKAQVAEMHSILLGAEADHVTVIGSSGDDGWFPTPRGWGGQIKEASPAARATTKHFTTSRPTFTAPNPRPSSLRTASVCPSLTTVRARRRACPHRLSHKPNSPSRDAGTKSRYSRC